MVSVGGGEERYVRQKVVIALGRRCSNAEDAVILTLVADVEIVVLGLIRQPGGQLSLNSHGKPTNNTCYIILCIYNPFQ